VRYGGKGMDIGLTPSNGDSLELSTDTQNDTDSSSLPATNVTALKMHEWTQIHVILNVGTPPTSPGNVTVIVTRPNVAPVVAYDHVSLAALPKVDGVLDPSAELDLEVGSFYSSTQSSPWLFAFDNVVFSAK
jgi:hypothetical protein